MVAVGGAIAVRLPSFSPIQSEAQGSTRNQEPKDDDGATEQERPGPALSFRLAASCRRASKNSFISHGAGAPSPERPGCGLFLGQEPLSLRRECCRTCASPPNAVA